MNKFKLFQAILELSRSKEWDTAKLEWSLSEVYESEEPDVCLCGHSPIIEICVLSNTKNGNTAKVGNVCVKKFIGLPSDPIFQAHKRIKKDITKSLNAEAISHAHSKGWINDWENNFYMSIKGKRRLTDGQLEKKVQVNEKLIRNMKRKASKPS